MPKLAKKLAKSEVAVESLGLCIVGFWSGFFFLFYFFKFNSATSQLFCCIFAKEDTSQVGPRAIA